MCAIPFHVIRAQIPFTSGPIPLCDTSTFTAGVYGIGTLNPPWMYSGFSLNSLTINITTDHPQALKITLTSPAGTTLLLSEFNGAGGENYTNTTFAYDGYASITTGTAPFTGTWMAQGGPLSIFDYEWADGTWTITVIDTACVGGPGPGNGWTPGWFDGSAGNGGFSFAFVEPPPPCWGWVQDGSAYICPGETVDIVGWYTSQDPGLNYVITLPNGTAVPDPSAVNAAGTYYVDAYDNWSGCYYWAMYTVMATSQVALGADQVLELCNGSDPVDLTQLVDLNGATAAWSFEGAPITDAAAATATAPGIYQLIGASPGNCSDTVLITLTNTDGPTLGADMALSICAGGGIDLTTLYNTAGYAVVWYFEGAEFTTPEAATNAGMYSLVVTSMNGCTATANVSIEVSPGTSLGADQSHVLCSNGSIDLTSLYVTGGLDASWTLVNVPVADPTAVNIAGIYQLIISSGPDCSDTAVVSIDLNEAPALGGDVQTTVCSDGTIDLVSYFNTTGLTSVWTLAGMVVPDPSTVAIDGSYMLVGMDVAGCSDTAFVDVTVVETLLTGEDQQISACEGAVVDLAALYDTGNNTATWTLNGVVVGDPTAITSSGEYTLTVTNASGCTSEAVVTVDLGPAPALGPDQAAMICAGVTFDLTSAFAAMGLDALWTMAGVAIIDPTTVNTAGVYTLVATHASGCSDTALLELSISDNVVPGPDQMITACDGSNVDLTSLYSTGTYTTTWTTNGAAVPEPTSITSGGTYTITAANADGCTGSAEVTLELVPSPAIGPHQQASICSGSTFDLTSVHDTNGSDPTWTLNGYPVVDPTSVAITGQYMIAITNDHGCTATAVFWLTVNENSSLEWDRTFWLCPTQTVDLVTEFSIGVGSASYTLNGSPVADPTQVSEPGTYHITVTDANGCGDEALAHIMSIECPCELEIIDDATCIQEPVRFTLVSDAEVLSVQWDLGAAGSSTEIDPLVRFLSAGEVEITVHATLSCGEASVERTIEISDCSKSCDIWLPSAFSPNDDTTNDTWGWYGECIPDDFSVEIYDRLGELIFHTRDPDLTWDGTFGGTMSPAGVYAYRVGYRLPYQERKDVVGSITLIR